MAGRTIRDIEKHWQQVWERQAAFQPEVDKKRKKFLCTFPYPYTNGLPHVGHLFTMMRVEAFARYKRARGYNVLFPQGWHCTGSPIVAAAKLVEQGNNQQIEILKKFGVPEDQIEKFSKPEHWVTYFVPNYKQDVKAMGMSVDWRREFITTDLNPHYDKFIRWQFRKLKQKGYVQKGNHPVVWDPVEKEPVSDHARKSGEGETPQEFLLIKFTHGNDKLVCATLRPETLPGATNLWLNPEVTYKRATVDGETWIACEECFTKLQEQDHAVKIQEDVPGAELIGQKVTTPDGRKIPVLPATFLSTDKGSGIVLSVPSDAPDDYVALRDLKEDASMIEQHGLEDVQDIIPIPIIRSSDLGNLAAVKVVEDMKIKHQKERKKLEEAKKLVYKKGFYEGSMLAGPHKGEPVAQAKEKVRTQLLEDGQAIILYELTGEVISRNLNKCVVKIVSDQWFLMYSDPKWKGETRMALESMRLYPEKVRGQFEYVLGWLNDWACTRSKGLGTHLPWDEKWLIESLSDSTLYNAYYTIADRIDEIPPEEIDDEFFDYVFLGTGKAPNPEAKRMRESFMYWYPVDFRNSGKDLVQSHLSFMLFNHVAIFDQEYWPKSYGVNGWVTVDGQKMSKSLGNFIPVRKMLAEYGADASRITMLNGGEGMDDPNWDSDMARTIKGKLLSHIEQCVEQHGTGRTGREPIDDWFESCLHRITYQTTQAMEETLFREAIQRAWFELGAVIRKYVHITGGDYNSDLMKQAIEAQTVMLQPFVPHIAEEVWSRIGLQGLASHAPWPVYEADRIDPAAEQSFELIEQTKADLKHVLGMIDVKKPKKATIIVANEWKYAFVSQLKELVQETFDAGLIIKELMATELKAHGQQVTKLVPRYLKDRSKIPHVILGQGKEQGALIAASKMLQDEFDLKVEVAIESESTEQKASQALPGKPAIVIG